MMLQSPLHGHPYNGPVRKVLLALFWKGGPGEEGGELTIDAARERPEVSPEPRYTGRILSWLKIPAPDVGDLCDPLPSNMGRSVN